MANRRVVVRQLAISNPSISSLHQLTLFPPLCSVPPTIHGRMTQPILIMISDNLHRRLQVVKENLNVSRICAQVIEQAVQVEEIKAHMDITTQEKAILRLRTQKQRSIVYWKQQGFNDGKQTAIEQLSYGEIKYIVQHRCIPLESDDALDISWFANYRYIASIFKEKYPTFDEEAYEQGWIEGVAHFWEQVKNQVEQVAQPEESNQNKLSNLLRYPERNMVGNTCKRCYTTNFELGQENGIQRRTPIAGQKNIGNH